MHLPTASHSNIISQSDKRRRTVRLSSIYMPILSLTGFMLVILFESGYLLSTPLSVLLLFTLTGWGLWQIRLSPLSPLTRLMILLYFMPFLTTLGYLFDPNYTWWYTPLSIAYMTDPNVTAGMLMVGLIGLVGLLTGMGLARALAPRRLEPASLSTTPRSLHPFAFVALLLMALFFSYINTPADTIFSAAYTAATGIAGRFNFNAAFLVSYTILVALFIDTEQEKSRPHLRSFKRFFILLATVIILIFFQLLRGDRDSFGLVVALAALYLTEPSGRNIGTRMRSKRMRRYLLIGGAGAIVLVSFLAISTLRLRVANGDRVPLSTAIIEGAQESTWSAVLLTNLSLAAQYHQNRMITENGRTYLDYLYSLPPGFITHALGIERPIEPHQGPNFWFTDISAGGLHIITVPFKNFHTPGVLVLLILFGYIIGRTEIIGQNPHWLHRLWYGAFFVGSAQWFWYGDMPFIREIMIYALVAILYGVARRVTGLQAAPLSARKTEI